MKAQELWTEVDRYFDDALIESDEALRSKGHDGFLMARVRS